jgi:predicted HD superfamily hydrolase involved in NAD metabolism
VTSGVRDAWREMPGDVVFCGDVARDAPAFLHAYGLPHIAVHCAAVAAQAQRLALRHGVDPDAAAVAGWLHDISAPIPTAQRLAAARAWEIPTLLEEEAFPLLIHQKLSAVIAERHFDIRDADTLSAIGCHTTLRAGATPLDQVLFLADKLAWDQPGEPPYRDELEAALADSLAAGVRFYLTYIWNRRHQLLIVHPWLADAYRHFS